MVAILAYPSSGTPFVDHHASILSIISLLIFILAIKTNSKYYWFFLPIILFLSFLTKQTPTGNIFFIITFLSCVYFLINFNIQKIIYGLIGSIFAISSFLIILFLTGIPFESFFEQYISFPFAIGKTRFEYFLFPLEFSRIFLRFKLIHIPLLIMIYITIKNITNNWLYIKNNDFIIIFSLVASSYAFIAHQLMTINGLFIFFIIPLLVGFAHVFILKSYKNSKNYFLYSIIALSIISTSYYEYKYIHKRDFMDLRKANFDNTINAKIIDSKLSGLNWVSCHFPDNPKREISNLLEAIDIIKNDKRKKSIITEYQFISVILSIYDYSPSQVWFINHVANEKKNSRFFKSYNKLLSNQIIKNKIEVAYLVKPFWQTDLVYEKGLSKDCYKKIQITEILDAYIFQECNSLQDVE